MKRVDPIRHLESHSCELLSGGSNHSVFVNRAARKSTTVPRQRDINDFLAKKICPDLHVDEP